MMTRKILIVISFSIIPFLSIAQEKLTKDEIYLHWLYYQVNRDKIQTNFDTSAVKLVDSLKTLQVDTIGIFKKHSYGRGYSSNTKMNRISPWSVYIYWVKNGKCYYQKVEKYFISKPKKIENSKLIVFYINNKETVNVNYIMPVITDASMSKKGVFRHTTLQTTRPTVYHIYCELNGNSTMKEFTDYDLENKDNIFYIDNENSIIKTWWALIENQIDEIEKQ